MRGLLRVLLCAAVLPGVSSAPLHAKPRFVTFSLGVSLSPSGINNQGAVTGVTNEQGAPYRGFVRQPDGTITSFDVPGSTLSGVWPASINDSGTVAGYYYTSYRGAEIARGFIRKPGGAIKPFRVPHDTQGDYPVVITSGGSIFGNYWHRHMLRWGFARTPDGTATALNCPTGTFVVSSANDAGEAAGSAEGDGGGGRLRGVDGSCTYIAAGHPFAINAEGSVAGADIEGGQPVVNYIRTPDGAVTNFQIPNGSLVYPVGINATRVIVGFFGDKVTGTQRGYIRSAEGHITVFDVPGSTGTQPTGINDAGDIVGWFAGPAPNYNKIGFIRYP